jgi:hypothetical protein
VYITLYVTLLMYTMRINPTTPTPRREEAVLLGVGGSGNLANKTNLMAITSLHMLFCAGNVLELYSFDGQRRRVWLLQSAAHCIRGESVWDAIAH